MKQSSQFKHESMHDSDSIKDILKSLMNGIAKGKVSFEDEDGQLTLEPNGLMRLKISAGEDDGRNKINLKITWDKDEKLPKGKTLIVSPKN